MNWKVVFQLSFFGLIMAFATISLIPDKVEPFFWLAIFITCAYFIAKVCTGKYFLHGFMLSMFNSVWITAVHIMFYNTYIANHPEMLKMSVDMPLHDTPKLAMLIVGPIFGAISGLVQGLFAFIASKLVKKTVSQ